MGYESYIIFSQHFGIISNEEVSLSLVGQKAMGLLDCDPDFTPSFFIIKSTLFRKWLVQKDNTEKILQDILATTASRFNANDHSHFIVRSSAKQETFDERGFYKSSPGNVPYGSLLQTIKETWSQNLSNFSKYSDNEFAIIVQLFIRPKLAGHLSNERRVSRSKIEWLLEIVSEKNEFLESKKFIAAIAKEHFANFNFAANNKKELVINLRSLAASIVSKDQRSHIEWVWDGKRAWVVQNDIEISNYKGTPPSSQWQKSPTIIESKQLNCFNNLSAAKKNWEKVRCVQTFIECGLPSGNIYILEDPAIIADISKGILNADLKIDLEWLLLYPILIRMDIQNADGYSNILLPRTETIFTLEKAVAFLYENSKKLAQQVPNANGFCFLIHRFIISDSCALAFSRPNIQKARIDSTWGIIEGLYYHPHDSFEVNLMNKLPQIKKQIRCKTEYIDVDRLGIWFSKRSGVKWDWAESLTKNQILDIAEYNTKIADFLDKPVTVMYFVGVDQTTGYPSILPWFYTTEEITESSEKFTDVIFSENWELLQSDEDFKQLESRSEKGLLNKITIKLKLNPGLLRDKDLIEKIGEFAKRKNIPIQLEGSILSHTYYILRKIGARVKCVDPFEPKYKKQKFYKLVRDKIPINIESKGERVRTVRIDSADLLMFLKRKAIEEAYEFFWEKEDDKIIEELADIYEVIRTSCRIFGTNIEEIEKIANKKTEKKGGFETGIVLVDTTESSLIDVINGSGESLLLKNNEIEKKGSLQKIRKTKSQKISFGIDNSITLPYVMLGLEKPESKEMNAPLILEKIQSIKITYSPKGIKIKFITSLAEETQKGQLSLFNEDGKE